MTAGCGGVFVNPGSKNVSLPLGFINPAANRKVIPFDFKGAKVIFVSNTVASLIPYGSETFGQMSGDEVHNGSESLKCVLNSNDYSGIIIDAGQSYNLVKARQEGYVLRFWIKGNKNNLPVYVALCDSKTLSHEVEVSLPLSQFKPVTRHWQLYQIPLSDFSNIGAYWNGVANITGVPIHWNEIEEFRVIDQKSGMGMYTVYVNEVAISPPLKESSDGKVGAS